jgi:hypothetical protein
MFAAPTAKSLAKIIRPLFRQIFDTAPDDLRPKWMTAGQYYYFPHNGAEIHIAGCNNGHEEDLRGTAAKVCLVDEAGLVDELDYLVEDILTPQLMTTGGSLIMASTPPRTPIHAFVNYAHKAQTEGNYSEYTIEESGYDKGIIEKFINEAGGKESATCQREYFCKFIVDKNFAIIPEWSERFVEEHKREEKLFQYFHKYVAMDIGGRDKTAILFGYYDFKNAKLIVEDELIFDGPQTTTELIASAVKRKEFDLWKYENKKDNEFDRPYMRVADNNNIIMLQDLGLMHDIHFLATSKDNLEAMVNQLRMWIIGGKLIIHPRCKETIACLKYGIWNDRRTEFTRNQAYGHYDALASLIYLVRNIDTRTNPIPENLGITADDFFIPKNYAIPQEGQELMKLFKINPARIN